MRLEHEQIGVLRLEPGRGYITHRMVVEFRQHFDCRAEAYLRLSLLASTEYDEAHYYAPIRVEGSHEFTFKPESWGRERKPYVAKGLEIAGEIEQAHRKRYSQATGLVAVNTLSDEFPAALKAVGKAWSYAVLAPWRNGTR